MDFHQHFGYQVLVEYDGGIDRYFDKALRDLANEFGASNYGSGCMLFGPQTRDIQFSPFKTEEEARLFIVKIQALDAIAGLDPN